MTLDVPGQIDVVERTVIVVVGFLRGTEKKESGCKCYNFR